MITEIQKFLTEDGKEFFTIEEAREHENELLTRERLLLIFETITELNEEAKCLSTIDVIDFILQRKDVILNILKEKNANNYKP